MGSLFRRYLTVFLLLLPLIAGCAKYNTFYNAKKNFDAAEAIREDYIKRREDPPKPTGQQKSKYEMAIRKAQKVLDEYPGHSLTDDVLFLQAKAYHRMLSYRMAIRKMDLLFLNYPASPYLEESYYLQGLNYLLLGAPERSQEYMDKLSRNFPESKFSSQTNKVIGDNAFALEDWDIAAGSYASYLESSGDERENEQMRLKIAQCYWEMGEYRQGAEILQVSGYEFVSTDISYRTRLMQARLYVRLGDYPLAEQLLSGLEGEAEIQKTQGELVVIRAESLVAQGLPEDASPLLENMPEEWNIGDVKYRSSDILAYIYLNRGDWQEAQEQIKEAVKGKKILDDYERSVRLKNNLNDYLAAENQLPDARGEKVARMKLLQANSMLFGFERPGEAARLYSEAAADTAADSTVAARSLYGAFIAYRDYLDKPDSALIFSEMLSSEYPESSQSFSLNHGDEETLLNYLLGLREHEQATNYVNLTEEELVALTTIKIPASSADIVVSSRDKLLRRRMIYRSRRDNIEYQPSELALQMQSAAAETGAESDTDQNERSIVGPDAIPGGIKQVTPDNIIPDSPESNPEEMEKEEKDEATEKKEEKKKKRSAFGL